MPNLVLMRKFIIVILGFLLMSASFVGAYAQGAGKSVRVRTTVIKNTGNVYKAPYHGDAVTWSYSEPAALLTLWFHYAAENTEIVIIKDGETIADETFDMSADEVLECDFSECEVGEYEVYVSAYGEAYVLGRFCVN